jgi:uncharacterized protein YndB with AHSA1/START domain
VTAKRKVVLERTYPATPEEVWELWTTPQGIEAWWGPDGFVVEVEVLDLSPGGEMVYTMRAIGADQIAYLVSAGMPQATTHTIVITEVDPPRRLAYVNMVDFIPETDTYEVATIVEFEGVDGGTKLTLTLEAMHDQQWTDLAVAGWTQELDKLRTALTGKETT